MSALGPGHTISHPNQSLPITNISGLGPGGSQNANYHPFRTSGLPFAAASNEADSTAFGGQGPTGANTRANHHFAADTSDHVAGDFGLDELLFRSNVSSGSENNTVHPDPRRQKFVTKSLTALNYINNNDTPTVYRLSRMTLGQAFNQMRLIGPQICEEDTALQQGGNSHVAELAATIRGQAYGPNIFLATARCAITEMSGLWLIFHRCVRKDGELFSEAWARAYYALNKPRMSKEEVAADKRERDLKAARAQAVANGTAPAAPPVPGGGGGAPRPQEHAYEDMYTGMLDKAQNAVCTREELCPESVWNPMTQTFPDDKTHPVYWHFWIPYHSPTGSPPDAAAVNFGIPVYVGHLQHAMRGENAPTQKQAHYAREMVFPRSRNKEYHEAKRKLDRMEYFVGNLVP